MCGLQRLCRGDPIGDLFHNSESKFSTFNANFEVFVFDSYSFVTIYWHVRMGGRIPVLGNSYLNLKLKKCRHTQKLHKKISSRHEFF